MAYLLLSAQSGVLAASAQPFTIDVESGFAKAGDDAYPLPEGGGVTADGGSGADFLLTDHAKQDFIYSSGEMILPSPAIDRRKAAIKNVQAALLAALPAQMTYRNTAPFSWQGTLAAPHVWTITDATHLTIAKIGLAAKVSADEPISFPWPDNFSLPDAAGHPVVMTAEQTKAFSYAVFTLIWGRTHYGTIELPATIRDLTPANNGEVSAKFNSAMDFDITAGWP